MDLNVLNFPRFTMACVVVISVDTLLPLQPLAGD